MAVGSLGILVIQWIVSNHGWLEGLVVLYRLSILLDILEEGIWNSVVGLGSHRILQIIMDLYLRKRRKINFDVLFPCFFFNRKF
jgi:hypothetical protein